ncbi:hypothetical protein EZS27_018620 [termite gut metagenome]|uniref:Uncharacterized protein n=1 Tax=termite gut metagenome TaxID=433724 RepID=A0A5J4RHV9_9ZZZZ
MGISAINNPENKRTNAIRYTALNAEDTMKG